MVADDFDRQMIRRCLQLARKAEGRTSPNPLVGSVVVKAGKIIGEGYHPAAGQPHAEIFALRAAGKAAQDSTIYVNLEPCNHYGRTPPCSEALIKAGVKKVVIGMEDCDPRVAGSGIKTLRAEGIEVIVGVEEEACQELNEAFIQRIKKQKPLGILKYAMTLDGKIATTTGHSAWISSKASRSQVHHLRSTCDAVVIGGNTVRKDNPQLTTHGVTEHNPIRVVMSRTLDLPEDCHLWNTKVAPTMVFTQANSNLQLQTTLTKKGVEVISLDDVTPQKVNHYLYRQGVSKILWECGGILTAKAISEGVIQKVIAFVAPKIIGGQTAPSPVGNLGFEQMTDALCLRRVNIKTVDQDIVVEGYLE